MELSRRRLLAFSALGLAASEASAAPSPAPSPSLWARGASALELKVEPDSPEDQSAALQRAIEQTAAARVPLMLPPGTYRAANLTLPSGARLVGCPGATRLLLAEGTALVSARDADHVTLTGLILDGGKRLAARGLVHFANGRGMRIERCEIVASGGDGIVLERVEGEVVRNTITEVAGAAIFSLDARCLTIGGNDIRGAGNNGILVQRSEIGEDGTLVLDNRIADIAAKGGDGGQSGDAIGILRAGNVVVRGNRIRNAVRSAVRANAAANLQVIGNRCSDLEEVALCVEIEGALLVDNVINDAPIGIAVCVEPRGGATLIANNLISDTARGAIIGLQGGKPATGDLARSGAERFARLAIGANQVR